MEENFARFIQRERDRLYSQREVAYNQQQESKRELITIDRSSRRSLLTKEPKATSQQRSMKRFNFITRKRAGGAGERSCSELSVNAVDFDAETFWRRWT